MYVVVYSSGALGVRMVVGPFAKEKEASDWGDYHKPDLYYAVDMDVMELKPPRTVE